MKRYILLTGILITILQAKAQLSTGDLPINVLWIIAEDLSPDLGSYGNDLVNTPHLDRLAHRGMRFTNAFATAPVCSPSRTALATGMYQTAIGAYHMRYPEQLMPPLSKGIQTIAQTISEEGYTTANILDAPAKGKIDWMFKHDPKEHFNAFYWKNLAGSAKPFFAQASLGLTHRPFVEPKPDQFDLAKISIPPYYPDHPVSRQDFAGYYASIEKLDEQVGQILDSLKKYDLDKNTLIFFFSDHGRPMSRAKNHHYDSGLKVPLIVYVPPALAPIQGYTGGSTSDQLLSLIDVSASTLAVVGAKKPAYMQGRVFLGEQTEEPRDFVFSASNRIGDTNFRSRSVRGKKYRYTRNYHHDFSINSSATAYRKQMHPIYHLLNILQEEGKLTPPQQALMRDLPYEELYDLENDPYETINLAKDAGHQLVLTEMRQMLDRWMVESNDQGLQEDSKALEDAFRLYGVTSYAERKDKIENMYQKVLNQVKTKRITHENIK